jgi:rod shape-determining protein MreC
MFSKRTVLILAAILLVTVNVLLLAITARRPLSGGVGGAMMAFAAPFQALATRVANAAEGLWRDYFSLVSIARQNQLLKQQLSRSIQVTVRQHELELENNRLRELLDFKRISSGPAIAAQIIGKDPSAWYKTVILDKGQSDGVQKGLPAVTAFGVVGQIVETATHQSRLLLIIDRNSAVDALVQRTRARGIVKGDSQQECYMDYVMHEDDVRIGDQVISSGFDGVYPKGLLLGTVSAINFQGSDNFKEVRIKPAVDFDKLEEVLIFLKPQLLSPLIRNDRR